MFSTQVRTRAQTLSAHTGYMALAVTIASPTTHYWYLDTPQAPVIQISETSSS